MPGTIDLTKGFETLPAPVAANEVAMGVTSAGNLATRAAGGPVREVAEAGVQVPLPVDWKGAVVGTAYTDTDTATPLAGAMVMVDCGNLENVTINVPKSDAASAGKSLTVINTNDKFAANHGTIILVPASGDKIGAEAAIDANAQLEGTANVNSIVLRADGNGGWWLEASGAGAALTAV